MKTLIMALLPLIIVGTGFAQQPGERGGGKKGMHHRGMHPQAHSHLMQSLQLTDAQKEQMKNNQRAYRKQMADLMAKEDITVKEQRDQRAALRKNFEQQTQALLTQEQRSQWKQLKAEQVARHAQMSEQRFDKMAEKLDLTPGQLASLKSYRQTMQAKMKTIRENDALDRNAKATQMKALKDEAHQNMANVLTPAQQAEWQKMHTSRKAHQGPHRRQAHSNAAAK